MREKGVSAKVSSNYYRLMEKTRLVLKNKYKINVKSHVKLTEMMTLAPPLYANKQWIKKIRGLK